MWDILGKLERIIGSPPNVQKDAARPGDQRQTGADTSKLLRHLGWRAHVGLDDGLARQVQWQRSLV